ncbi:MAG: hypothetical protein HC799_16185 [Limnothrix sp. RL_2_0]|nr:hypothetical protein [Limnothrix sp. RL_2_0]
MADCPNLATQSDIQAIQGAIADLAGKIPDNIATKEDIAGVMAELAQIKQQLNRIEAEIDDTKQTGQNVWDFLSRLIDEIADLIRSIVQSIESVINNAIDGVVDVINTGLEQLGLTIRQLIESTEAVILQGIQSTESVLNTAIETTGDIILAGIDEIGSIVRSAIQLMREVNELAGRIWDGLSNFLDVTVGQLFRDLRELAIAIANNPELVGQFIAGLLDGMKDAIIAFIQGLEGIINQLFDSVFGILANILEEIKSLVHGDRPNDAEILRLLNEALRALDILEGMNQSQLSDLNTIDGKLGSYPLGGYAEAPGNVSIALEAILNRLFSLTDGGGGGSENSSDIAALETELNSIASDIDDLKKWLLGGLNFVDGDSGIQAILEDRVRAELGQVFNAGLTTGRTSTITNLNDLILAYISILYGRAGYQDYPVSVPALPLDSGDPPLQIVSASRFNSWQTKFIDNGIGAFPFEITVEDSDLIKVGDQPITASFPNIAESLAELVGLLITTKSITEANTQFDVRILGELASTRKQGFVAYKLTEAIADYLGFETKQKTEKMKFGFNPLVGVDGTIDKISEILKSKEIDIKFEEENERRSLEEKLVTLLEAARITKTTNFRKVGENDIKELKQFIKDALENTDDPSDFDTFIENFELGWINRTNITDNTKPYNRDYERRPKVRELGDQSDDGVDIG